jgi:hypothetical protein
MEENVHDVEIGETELDVVEATSVELEVSSEVCDATGCQGQSPSIAATMKRSGRPTVVDEVICTGEVVVPIGTATGLVVLILSNGAPARSTRRRSATKRAT